MKKLLTLLGVTAVLFFNSSCNQGPTGPEGPAGNANVKSMSFTVTANQWYHIGTTGTPGERFETILTVPIITQDIVSTGAVNMYISQNGNQWTAMPYTYPTGTGPTYGFTESWICSYSLNQAIIDLQDSDFNTQPPSATVFVKIVAVAASGRIANPDLDWNNYSAVKAAFDLKD